MRFTLLSLVSLLACCSAFAESYDIGAWNKRDTYRCSETEQVKIPVANPANSVSLVDLCIHPDFDEYEEKLLQQAYGRMVRALADKNVYECTKRGVSKTDEASVLKTHESFLIAFVLKALGARSVGSASTNGYFFISPLDEKKEPSLLADGVLNFFENPKLEAEGRGFFKNVSLGVSKKALRDRNFRAGERVEFWSAAMVSAYLKNLGFAESAAPQAGTLSHELAKCILWQGTVPETHRTLPLIGGRS